MGWVKGVRKRGQEQGMVRQEVVQAGGGRVLGWHRRMQVDAAW